MREGGLSAIFFSIWIPGTVTGPTAVQRALDQIAAVRETVLRHPNDLVLCTTAEEIRHAKAANKIAVLMGVEGGHMINNSLANLRQVLRARRALYDADAHCEHRLGGFVHRQARRTTV